MTPISTESLMHLTEDLRRLVSTSLRPETLAGATGALAEALRRFGIPVDRLQLPLSILFGLKHPLYAGIILTWTSDGGSKVWLRPRARADHEASLATLRSSPYAAVVLDGAPFVRMSRGSPDWRTHDVLRRLEEEGFTDYIATVAELPDGARQVISIATRAEAGLGDDIAERLQAICPTIALALFGIYQSQTSFQIATTYLGQRTGQLVMAGQMGRGQSQALRAAVAFLDIRGFTQLSNDIGVESMVPLLNASFEAIDEAVRPLGGELLKLMGDAVLVVFPRLGDADCPMLEVLDALLRAIDDVAARTEPMGVPIQMGAGLHIGDVLYGNVGAKERHDFTVMGPAVNLASRLEGLTKSIGTDLVVSDAVAVECGRSCGSHADAARQLRATIARRGPLQLKGEPEPVWVWSVHRSRE